MKPIIMSTEDVRAILDGRKTMMRIPVKPQPEFTQVHVWDGKVLYDGGNRTWCWKQHVSPDCWNEIGWLEQFAPYKPGDVLYVREAWQEVYKTEYNIDNPNEPLKITDLIVGFDNLPKQCVGLSREWSCSSMPARNKYYVYAASKPEYTDEKHELKWRPSTQMPREAARLFLRVKDVRAERVQDISAEDCEAEGYFETAPVEPRPRSWFSAVWDARNAKRGYGWDTNPWVWVYSFERVDKPAGWPGAEVEG